MANRQTAKAGDNSVQLQANTIVVGLNESRVREIVDERLQIALKDFSVEADKTTTQRSGLFNEKLIYRMATENLLPAFADPSFQLLLIEAQKHAASTERKLDYELLSELMVHRFKKGTSRNVRAGVSRAIEIVDQISDEALLALTVYHSLMCFTPVAGNMQFGFRTLDHLFGKLFYAELPTDTDWLDHLDILDAVRVSRFHGVIIGGQPLLEDLWYNYFDGYTKKGIKLYSGNYKKASRLLAEKPYLSELLVENSFDANYVKIEVSNKREIGKEVVVAADGRSIVRNRLVVDDEIAILEKVYDLYDDQGMDKQDFIDEIEKYPNLKKLREWWNTLSGQSIQITSVGRVLAHSNAQRIDKNLPPLD